MDEFLDLIAKVQPLDRSRAFIAYQEVGAPMDWIIKGKKRFPPQSTLFLRGKRFALSLLRWFAAGCPLVSSFIRLQRGLICSSCQFWIPQCRLGLGKCDHPECGCSSLKRFFGTEVCPANKWPEWTRLPFPQKPSETALQPPFKTL